MIRIPSHWRTYAPLPLRLVLGLALTIAGFFKLLPSGHRNIVHELGGLGLPFAEPLGWIVGVAELLCGLGLMAGAFTALAAVVMIANIGGLLVISLARGIWYPEDLALAELRYFPYRLPSLEASAVFLAGLLALLVSGPGPCSAGSRLKAAPEDREAGRS